MWNVTSGALKNTLEGHTGEVTSVAFSPNGQTLVSGSRGNTLKLWDVSHLQDYSNKTSIKSKIDSLASVNNMQLKGISIVFDNINNQQNLFDASKSKPPMWPKHHPIYLMQQANNNDTKAMIQLGNYAYRDFDFSKAKYWFEKALNAGNAEAKQRLQALQMTVTLKKTESD
ncbi:hypothetical protein GCM10009410_03620 [Shewanella ulleungensis]|uniref:Sel1 repeat family protein n=1 Tax=Shewanella ulleungensis TaxID=2282699 RepID=A0ABQ2QCG1_9GAMM|nr:hypothetical protein [Shewanella ulleungensis]GGP74970.1 hypothetical protein GCM10009410_03620 [Shewanella ulleungensis]